MSLLDQIANDLDAFIDSAAGFAVSATVDGVTVSGIYDAGYAESNDIEGVAPSLLCKTVDVAEVTHGDAVTAGGIAYKVAGVEPDGTGLTRLVLREV